MFKLYYYEIFLIDIENHVILYFIDIMCVILRTKRNDYISINQTFFRRDRQYYNPYNILYIAYRSFY